MGRSRDVLRAQSAAWNIDEDVCDAAVLLLSELVTNAVRHAARPPRRSGPGLPTGRREREGGSHQMTGKSK
ncbi:hypothetical protein [Streptomyces sp. NPDC003077]|uniref:ATP-binding protein n=1 Tax=Streptomyces sp. NPDC003077 TaxID=3154443 RepID=UPI0033AA4932